MTDIIEIDGRKVPFKATAAIPRLYRIRFGRDIMIDMQILEKSARKVEGGEEQYSITDLTLFENVAYIMAKHAAPEDVPNTAEEWLDGFETFSIYYALPKILNLWGINEATTAESKKKLAVLTAK